MSPELYRRAQQRFDDPERRAQRAPSREYPLRGRLSCRHCGAGMVGQAVNRGRYLYYRCNRPYDPDEERRCASRQVRTEALESAVRGAIEDVLANPQLAVGMAERLRDGTDHPARLSELGASSAASTTARTGSSTSIPTAVSPRTPWIGSRTSSQGAEARSIVSGRS